MNLIIPEFLKDQFKKRKPNYSKFTDEINQFLINFSKHYNWETNDLRLIFKLIKNGQNERPICGYKNCNNLAQISTDYHRFSKGCCNEHSSKIGLLEKYGCESAFEMKEVRDKAKKTMIKRFGVENSFASKEVMKKCEKTMIEKYGVKKPLMNKVLLEKSQETCLKNYGVKFPSQNKEVREKTFKTMLDNHGVKFPMQDKSLKNKIAETTLTRHGGIGFQTGKAWKSNLIKFGVENPMQNPQVMENNLKSQFSRKEYIWQTGEVSIVQGYEPIVLSELEQQGYKFQDVITDAESMPEIWYEFEGKQRRYFPDFYIPKENLIIEVKSEYTLQADFEKNQTKFEATKNLGFDFKLEVR